MVPAPCVSLTETGSDDLEGEGQRWRNHTGHVAIAITLRTGTDNQHRQRRWRLGGGWRSAVGCAFHGRVVLGKYGAV